MSIQDPALMDLMNPPDQCTVSIAASPVPPMHVQDAPRAPPVAFMTPCTAPHGIPAPKVPPVSVNIGTQPPEAPLSSFVPTATPVLRVPHKPPEQRFQLPLVPPWYASQAPLVPPIHPDPGSYLTDEPLLQEKTP